MSRSQSHQMSTCINLLNQNWPSTSTGSPEPIRCTGAGFMVSALGWLMAWATLGGILNSTEKGICRCMYYIYTYELIRWCGQWWFDCLSIVFTWSWFLCLSKMPGNMITKEWSHLLSAAQDFTNQRGVNWRLNRLSFCVFFRSMQYCRLRFGWSAQLNKEVPIANAVSWVPSMYIQI